MSETVHGMNDTFSSAYCTGLEAAHVSYKAVHGYVSVSVCAAGAVSNILALTVLLARPELASPTFTILAALAATDALVMLEYIPYALHTYVLTERPRAVMFSKPWAFYVLFHANFAQAAHTASIWLAVTLATWRYLAVYHPSCCRAWCTPYNTRLAVAAALLGAPLLCTPLFLAFWVTLRQDPVFGDTVYLVELSTLARANDGVLQTINYWVYGVVLKIFPCALLSFLSQRLVAALLEARKRRRELLNKADKDGERTSRLLVAVLLLFLATELPQGILGLLSVLLGEPFFASCYLRLGEFMDALALASSALNFPLYCIMSRQFRAACLGLLRRSTGTLSDPQRISSGPSNGQPLQNLQPKSKDEMEQQREKSNVDALKDTLLIVPAD